MRIIGGNDYYDGVQALGQELGRVFARSSFQDAEGVRMEDCGLEPLSANRLMLRPENGTHRYADMDKVENRSGTFHFRPLVVWFAGMRHAGVFVDGRYARTDEKVAFCAWSAAEVREFLKSVGSDFAERPFRLKGMLTDDNIDGWYGSEGTSAEKDWLISNRVSIAISDGMGYEYGHRAWQESRRWKFDTDGLKDLGFARILSPWEAFQRLDAWIGGTLAHPGAPTAEISNDAVRRDKHGFDAMSFKKPKSVK